MTTQTRLQRTYAVTLRPFSAGDEPVTVEVNLSYPLRDLNAVDVHGAVVEANSDAAQLEAIRRLRRLAAAKRTTVTPALVDGGDWAVRMVRQVLVTVTCDDGGRPLPHAR